MNKLLTNLLTVAGLLLPLTNTQAHIFVIEPVETFHEIVEGRNGIIKYRVLNDISDKKNTAEVLFIDDTKNIIPGVRQICESEEHCVQSCGNLSVDYTASNVCRATTELKPMESCELLLCVDADDITPDHQKSCVERDGESLEQCRPAICSEREYYNSCNFPVKENALYIKQITPEEGAPISITQPGPGKFTKLHKAALKCGQTYQFEIRNDSNTQTAYNIVPFFTNTIQSQLEIYPGGAPYDASDCRQVGPGKTCIIEITPQAETENVRYPQQVVFSGTNTDEALGFVTLSCSNSPNPPYDRPLRIQGFGVGFFEPSTRELTVRNTSDDIIKIKNIKFSKVKGVHARHMLQDADDCIYNPANSSFMVPPHSSCGINLEASVEAYLTGKRGKVILEYVVGHEPHQRHTTGFVWVAPIQASLNNGNPILLPRDSSKNNINATHVSVPVKNLGNFVWQDVTYEISPAITGVNIDSSGCPADLAPEEECELVLVDTLSNGVASADNYLIAQGINGHTSQKILQNQISVVAAPAHLQHLQYQAILITNNVQSDEPVNITLENVSFSLDLIGEVKWCEKGSDCIYNYKSCRKNEPIPSGKSCLVWLKSEPSNADPFVKSGEVYIDLKEGDSSSYRATLSLDKAVKLYATGHFDSADDVTANNIAQWDGTKWDSLNASTITSAADEGLSGIGYGLTLLNGDLVVVGEFVSAGNAVNTDKVALWRGSSWSGLRSSGSTLINGTVFSATAQNLTNSRLDGLVIGGSFNQIQKGSVSINTPNLAQWTPDEYWSPLGNEGNGTNGPVNAVSQCADGLLCVGGSFRKMADSSTKAQQVMGWTGSNWQLFGTNRRNGTNNTVRAFLRDSNNEFYAVGDFTRAFGHQGFWRRSIRTFHIAKWNNQEKRWHQVGSRKSARYLNTGSIYAITKDPRGNIMVGGEFSGKFAHVAILSGQQWTSAGEGLDGPVYALTSHGQYAYAGGDFDGPGMLPQFNNIARWYNSSWSSVGEGFKLTGNNGDAFVSSLLVADSITIKP